MKTNRAAQGALTGLRGMRDINILRLFLLPTIFILVVINIFPLFWSAFLSFTRYSVYEGGSPIWIGVDNYIKILSDEYYWRQFTTTAIYVIIVVTAELLIGFLLAFLLKEPNICCSSP